MKQAGAKKEIRAAWLKWIEAERLSNPNGRDALRFYNNLQSGDGAALLDFIAAGDKWQVTQGWLLRDGPVSD